MRNRRFFCSSYLAGKNQDGVVLVVALIALVSLLIAGLALVRSSDTTGVIAGNFVWKESSIQASDVGVDLAFATLTGIANSNKNNIPVANQYFSVMQAVDGKGIPTGINWSAVPTTAVAGTGNNVQYVIERLCNGSPGDPVNGPAPLNTAELSRYCITQVPQGAGMGGSMATGHVSFFSNGAIYYRVTVRVTGPRDAVSMVQGMISL